MEVSIFPEYFTLVLETKSQTEVYALAKWIEIIFGENVGAILEAKEKMAKAGEKTDKHWETTMNVEKKGENLCLAIGFAPRHS